MGTERRQTCTSHPSTLASALTPAPGWTTLALLEDPSIQPHSHDPPPFSLTCPPLLTSERKTNPHSGSKGPRCPALQPGPLTAPNPILRPRSVPLSLGIRCPLSRGHADLQPDSDDPGIGTPLTCPGGGSAQPQQQRHQQQEVMAAAAPLHGWGPERPVPGTRGRRRR